MDWLQISQLLCSRLCHDLITPVGAVSSGLEILADCEEKDRAQIMEIIRNSADTSSSRLVYFRAAFGSSKSGPLASPQNLVQLIDNFLRPLKISFQWQNQNLFDDHKSISFDFGVWGKIVLNLMLILVELAPYGGKIVLKTTAQDSFWDLLLSVEGNLLALKPEVQDIIENKETEITAHTIHVYLVREMIKNEGVYLSIEQKDSNCIKLQVTQEISERNRHASLF